MADVQKENGYTPVANELLEQLVKLPLNGTQLRIICLVWRYTYGFSRKNHTLSEGFISNGTGIHKKQIQREMNELIRYSILAVVKEATFSSPRIIQFNKNFDEWEVTKKLPGSKKDTHTGSDNVTSTGSENVTQENNNKSNIKTTYSAEFEKFYSEYPRAEDKKRSFTNWKTQRKHYTADQLMAACINYKKAKEGTDKQYLKSSANFLGRERPFEDYLEENFNKEKNSTEPAVYPYGKVVRAPEGWQG